ncbi:MAG: hypothetical protein GY850_31685 [bacterium]|nr:hypothetical protein [bacterium]
MILISLPIMDFNGGCSQSRDYPASHLKITIFTWPGGQYGQFIFAIPSLEMVVVFASNNEETEEFMMGIHTILYDHILQAVEEY